LQGEGYQVGVTLASHYLIEPSFCRPGEGHDKGGVEARGKPSGQALVPIPSGPTLEGINRTLPAPARCPLRAATPAATTPSDTSSTRSNARLRPVEVAFLAEAATIATVTPHVHFLVPRTADCYTAVA
jgi:hypothetical protein